MKKTNIFSWIYFACALSLTSLLSCLSEEEIRSESRIKVSADTLMSPFHLVIGGSVRIYDKDHIFVHENEPEFSSNICCGSDCSSCGVFGLNFHRQHWRSKVKFDEIDFSKPINLRDTAKFWNSDSCKTCDADFFDSAGHFYIYKSRVGKWTLFLIKDLIKRCTGTIGDYCYTCCDAGILAVTYIQENGELNFLKLAEP